MFWPPLGPLRPPWGGRWRQGRRRFRKSARATALSRRGILELSRCNPRFCAAPHPRRPPRRARSRAAHGRPPVPHRPLPAGRGPNAPPGAAGPPRGRPPAPPPPAFCPPAAEKRLGSEKRLPIRPRGPTRRRRRPFWAAGCPRRPPWARGRVGASGGIGIRPGAGLRWAGFRAPQGGATVGLVRTHRGGPLHPPERRASKRESRQCPP